MASTEPNAGSGVQEENRPQDKDRGRPVLLIGVLALVLGLAAGLTGGRQWGLRSSPTSTLTVPSVTMVTVTATPTDLPTETASPSTKVTAGPVAVFIGDSFTSAQEGDGVRWTSIVAAKHDWSEVNLGFGGIGFVTGADGEYAQDMCGQDLCPTFVELGPLAIRQLPKIVVIEGGPNDGDADTRAAATALITMIRAALPQTRIIMIAPLSVADGPDENLLLQRSYLSEVSQELGVEYVDIGDPLLGHPELMGDDVHPNADGYRIWGDLISAAIG